MKPLHIIIALLVSAFLYLLVIERETLLEFAGAGAGNAKDVKAPETMTQTSEMADATAAEPRVSVVAMHSKAQTVDSAVLLRGRTEAARQVNVAAETSGKVISDPLRKGAYVETGQTLCQLDPGTRAASLAEAKARLIEARARLPEAKAQLAGAAASLVEAEINENAARRLGADGFASETRVAAAKAALKRAGAQVESARAAVQAAQAGAKAAGSAVAAVEKDIERLTITAPFAGLLETDSAELGALLQPGALCATVIQLDPIKLVGFAPETEVDRVKTGAMAGARLATGREVTGQVRFLSRSADPLTRTFRVEIEVPNKDLTISDGQTVEIIVAAQGTSAHLLPQSALTLNNEGTLGVRYVEHTGAQQIVGFAAVTIVRDTTKGIWLAGLPDDVDVIISGQEYVIKGVAINVIYRDPGL